MPLRDAARAPTSRCWPKWTGPWAHCSSRPRPAYCVLRRQREVFRDARFQRLGDISVGHLYKLRNSAPYRARHVVLTKTRPTRRVDIGVRKAPAPEGRPDFIRIDSRPPWRPGRHQGPVPHQRGGLCCPMAGGDHRSDHLRGAPAARHRADAGAVPVRDPGLSRRQRQRVRQPPGGQDGWTNSRSSSPAAARATATTTAWSRPRTARWCARSSVLRTSGSATPRASTPAAPSTSVSGWPTQVDQRGRLRQSA